jgi:WD40 repeat protein
MDIAYSPTGREFVTGSYDRTVRIFRVGEGKSREVYHTTRMQRVFTVNYTPDSRYVLSGSDDTNVRLWKAKSSDPLTRVRVLCQRAAVGTYPQSSAFVCHRLPSVLVNIHSDLTVWLTTRATLVLSRRPFHVSV